MLDLPLSLQHFWCQDNCDIRELSAIGQLCGQAAECGRWGHLSAWPVDLAPKSTALCILPEHYNLFEVEMTNCDLALAAWMTLVVLGVRSQSR